MPPSLPGILVPPDWLEKHLADPAVRLVDLREPQAHSEGHLPGAVQLDLATLGTSRPGQDNVLLGAEDFSDRMDRLGISGDTVVVAYDDQWGLAAARLAWALQYYGHPAAALLDGGWDRWVDEGRPLSRTPPDPAFGRFLATPTPAVGIDLQELVRRLPDPGITLLDTRTRGEFEAGHVPGALSWDWFQAVPPGSWDVARDVSELREEWVAMGVDPESEVIVYCRSGMRAAHTYVVLKHAGYSRVRLFDGSWQEWSMTETGARDG